MKTFNFSQPSCRTRSKVKSAINFTSRRRRCSGNSELIFRNSITWRLKIIGDVIKSLKPTQVIQKFSRASHLRTTTMMWWMVIKNQSNANRPNINIRYMMRISKDRWCQKLFKELLTSQINFQAASADFSVGVVFLIPRLTIKDSRTFNFRFASTSTAPFIREHYDDEDRQPFWLFTRFCAHFFSFASSLLAIALEMSSGKSFNFFL